MPWDPTEEVEEDEVRSKIFEFAEGRCLRCDIAMTLEPGLATSVCVDLVRPRVAGGRCTWDNVQPLCQTCAAWKAQAMTRDV
jgi:5-methylcytosine-specific restriction endonuclease McrA